MARPKKLIPSYRKHKASGQAFVELNGKRIYLGLHGSKASKVEYDRQISEWLVNGRQLQPAPDSGGLTIAELIVAYMHHVKRYYVKDGKQTSEVADIILSLRPLNLLYSKHMAVEFGPTALKAVRQRMIDDGLARTTTNQRIGRVVRMFKWGAASELIPASIHQSLSMVEGLRRGRTEARETAPVKPVEDTVVDATLPHLPDVVADMVRFQRFTGCRPAEVCMMRPCDVDRTGDVWVYRPESHKTQHHGRERLIFVGPQAQAVLLRYLARNPEDHCFRPCDSEEKRRAALHHGRKTPMSCGNRPGSNRKRNPRKTAGESYNPRSYHAAVRRACVKNDLDRWSPNQLRHTAATQIRRDFGLEAAQVVLGHAQANVTQVYAERDIRKGFEVARLIG